MKIKTRFPYEIMEIESYSIDNIISFDENKNYVNLKYDLNKLINIKNLEPFVSILLELNCTYTLYRNSFVLPKVKDEIHIEKNLISKTLEYELFLIKNQTSECLINQVKQFNEHGECLGIIERGTIELKLGEDEIDSYFCQINRSLTNMLSYDYKNDYIVIQLPEEDYDNFKLWYTGKNHKLLIKSTIIFSALQQALNYVLISESDFNEYEDTYWYKCVNSLVQKKFGKEVDSFDKQDIPNLVNMILDKSIFTMFKNEYEINSFDGEND